MDDPSMCSEFLCIQLLIISIQYRYNSSMYKQAVQVKQFTHKYDGRINGGSQYIKL